MYMLVQPIPTPTVPTIPAITPVSQVAIPTPTPVVPNALLTSALKNSQNEPNVPQKLEGGSLLGTLPIVQQIEKDAHTANLPVLG